MSSNVDSASSDVVETATADRLIRVAARLFRSKGYASTTTREISDELGIQKGSLYHHIKTKEDLLHWICVASLDIITQRVQAALDASPPDRRLRSLIAAHVMAELEDQDLHTVMLVELKALSEPRRQDVVDRRDVYERLVYDTIVAEQEAGALRVDIDPKYLSLALLDLLNWAIFWYRSPGELAVSDLAGHLTSIFIDGAASRP